MHGEPEYDPCGAGQLVTLQAGDEVTIPAGCGFPASGEDRLEVIADVHGFSAITGDGIRLRCDDGSEVTRTGRHFGEGEYEISQEVADIIKIAKQTPFSPSD